MSIDESCFLEILDMAASGEPAGSGGRRQVRKQETRAALIEAALVEFALKGFDSPSLDAICARAGYTRGAFYVHFDSRDGLVAAAMEWVLGRVLDAVIGAEGSEPGLRETVARYVTLATQGRDDRDARSPVERIGQGLLPPLHVHHFLEACERSPDLLRRFRTILAQARERVAGVVVREQAAGHANPAIAPEELSTLLILLALGLRVAADIGLPLGVESARDALLALILPPKRRV